MRDIIIKCDFVNIDRTFNGEELQLHIQNPNEDFIGDIPVKNLVSGFDNQKLLKAIIENDEEILHNYLEQNGYIFNKAYG